MSETQHEPIDTRITNFGDLVFRTEETEPGHITCTTIELLTGTAQGAQQVLPLDPLRKEADLIALDAPFVLCDSAAQAMSPRNQDAMLPGPDGAVIPMNVRWPVKGTAQLWGACPVTTRIAIVATRRNS